MPRRDHPGNIPGMRLLRRITARFRPRRITDLAFGPLEFRGVSWRGQLPSAPDIAVYVFADESGPTARHRELLAGLTNRFDDLMAAIEAPLADEYRKHRDAWKPDYEKAGPPLTTSFDDDFPPLRESKDIWSIARLTCVEFAGNDRVDLCLIFAVNWGDPEHDLTALIKDWKVIDIGTEG